MVKEVKQLDILNINTICKSFRFRITSSLLLPQSSSSAHTGKMKSSNHTPLPDSPKLTNGMTQKIEKIIITPAILQSLANHPLDYRAD